MSCYFFSFFSGLELCTCQCDGSFKPWEGISSAFLHLRPQWKARERMSHVAKREGLFFLIPSGAAKEVRKEASCSLTIDCEVAVSMVTGFFFSRSAAKCSNNKKNS